MLDPLRLQEGGELMGHMESARILAITFGICVGWKWGWACLMQLVPGRHSTLPKSPRNNGTTCDVNITAERSVYPNIPPIISRTQQTNASGLSCFGRHMDLDGQALELPGEQCSWKLSRLHAAVSV